MKTRNDSSALNPALAAAVLAAPASPPAVMSGAGDDTYHVPGDVVVENPGEGRDLVISTVTYTLGANVEELTLDGSDNINGTGNELSNVIYGNSGDNVLTGLGDRDYIRDGAGNDTLYGGDGADVLYAETGVNQVFAEEGDDYVYASTDADGSFYSGGNGTDSISFFGRTGELGVVVIDLAAGTYTDIDRSETIQDFENVSGTGGADSITGTSAANRLYGANGSDTIYGLDGNDTLGGATQWLDDTSDAWSDWVDGGAGDDNVQSSGRGMFMGGVGDDAVYAATTAAETLDGGEGNDSLLLIYPLDNDYLIDLATGTVSWSAHSILGFENAYAGRGNDTILGTDGGNLVSGNEGNDSLAGLEGNDSVRGSYGHDTLYGGAGADVLDAGLYGVDNDLLSGDAGADTMTGYDGNDTYYVDSTGDRVIEASNLEGYADVIYSSVSYSLSGRYIEFLILTGSAAINATGNSLAQSLTGNAAANTLNGLDGNDRLDGGGGADTLNGGGGYDTFVIDGNDAISEAAGGGTDLVEAALTYTLGATLENLTLTGSGDFDGTGNDSNNVLTGNAGRNTLTGGLGHDTLKGGSGNDYLTAGDGNDLVLGGTGDDSLYGGLGADTVSFADVGAGVAVLIGDATPQNTGGGGLDIMSSFEHAIGSAFNDTLTGNDGANRIEGGGGHDRLYGGAGADTLVGGYGNDTFVLLDLQDTIVEGYGTDTAADCIETFVDIDFYTYDPGSVERVVVMTTHGLRIVAGFNYNATILVGNSGSDTLIGGSHNDVLSSGGGMDWLEGGSGYDRLEGSAEAGEASLTGGMWNDTYVVYEGDRVYEQHHQGTDTVRLWTSYSLFGRAVEIVIMEGSDNLSVTANSLANTITGNSGNNWIDGAGGKDTMAGGLGDDTYYVDNAKDDVDELHHQGTDTVFSSVSYTFSGRAAEVLTLTGTGHINGTGNSLANTITGNSGDNRLDGGGGKDTLAGGLGADVFLFKSGSGKDVVADFSAAQNDSIDIHAYTNGVANAGLVSQSGADVIIALDSSNVITVLNTTQADLLSHIAW